MIVSEKLAKQYELLKAQTPDCVLVMQVGAFMQVMNEDARAISKVTGLKLQMAAIAERALSARYNIIL